MSAWVDQTSRNRGEPSDSTPRVYHRRAGAFRLSVHRHIHYPPDVWLFTCEPIATARELKSRAVGRAQNEADEQFAEALREALNA